MHEVPRHIEQCAAAELRRFRCHAGTRHLACRVRGGAPIPLGKWLVAPSRAVRQFLSVNGWSHRVGLPEQFAQLARASQRTAVALDGSDVIGFARAITDGQSNGYLSMVAVSPEHRRKGVGTALVKHITSRAALRDLGASSWA
jgi:ribosomal protein S18 acetylase RimI-like enzyme